MAKASESFMHDSFRPMEDDLLDEGDGNVVLEFDFGVLPPDEQPQDEQEVLKAVSADFVVVTIKDQFISMQDGINQTLGMDAEKFAALGLPSRENPPCQASY